MRYWLLSLTMLMLVVGVGYSQDKKKDPAKEAKKKDPVKDPAAVEFKEPKDVGGKTFDQWRKEIKSLDPSKREVAMKMILGFGAIRAYDAIDDVMAELDKHTATNPVDLSVRVNGIMALSTIFKYKNEPDAKHLKAAFLIYKKYLKDPQVILRLQTVKGLPYLGPTARDAFPEVLELVRDNNTWEVRKEAISIAVALANSTKKGDPMRSNTIKELRVRAKESSNFVRMAALQGLAVLSSPDVPQELYKQGLEDPAFQVRLTAIQTLGAMAPKMSQGDKSLAVTNLNKYLQFEKDATLNVWTHATLMTIAGKVTSVDMAAITSKVKHKDLSVSSLALQIISMSGKDAIPLAQKAVLDAVRDADPSVRAQALQVVCTWGKDAKPMALATVLDAIQNDTDAPVRIAAIHATLCMQAFEAVPVLEKLQKDEKDKLEKDEKRGPAIHDACATTIDNFTLLAKKMKEDKEKKDKGDKKTDKK